MTSIMEQEVVLAGPYTGRTMRINGHQFTDGVCFLALRPEVMSTCLAGLARYQAYPVGSRALKDAQRHWAAHSGQEMPPDGKCDPEESPEQGPAEPVHGDVQQTGSRAAAPAAAGGGPDADPTAGQEGVRASGNGQTDPRVPDEQETGGAEATVEPNEKISRILLALDPEDDAHWTKGGLPAVLAVEDALGETGFNRRDLDAAMPGWNRDKARDFRETMGGK